MKNYTLKWFQISLPWRNLIFESPAWSIEFTKVRGLSIFVTAFYTLLLWYTHSTFLRFWYKITRKMYVKLSTDFSSLWGCTGWRWVIECKLQIFNLGHKPTFKTTIAFLIDLLTAFYSVSCKTCKMTSIAYLSSYHHSLRIWLPQKWSPMYLTKNI